MISCAVASATPTPTAVARTRAGGTPPRPLSELATDDLVRPDDGDDVFEIATDGALVDPRSPSALMTRLDGVHITGGDLTYELAMRRSRGHNTDEPFDHGGSRLHAVSGRGYLIALPGKARSPRSASTTTSSICARTWCSRSRPRCAGRTATCPGCAASCRSSSSAAMARSRCGSPGRWCASSCRRRAWCSSTPSGSPAGSAA